jgi:hypothetical protein
MLAGWALPLAACRGGPGQSSEAAKPEGAVVLNAAELRTLRAFCQTVLPGPAASRPVEAVPLRMDSEISFWAVKPRGEFRSLLGLLENGTRYFLFSWRLFSDLSEADRRAYLEGWESSWLDFRRQGFQILRLMAFFYFYSQDETWKSIGYDGPWVKGPLP